MRKSLIAAAAIALAASAPAFAKKPVKMTEKQMDQVTAGALINAVLVDVVDVNNNNVAVAIPVNAAVAIGVLTGAPVGAGSLQRPGRIVQTQ
jgi:hypothetical protein